MPFNLNETGNDFPIEQQRLSNWCWAACAVSISTFYEGMKIMTQSDLVASILKIPACATGKPIPACNKTLDLEIVLDRIRHLDGDPVEVPLSADNLNASLKRGKPVGCQMDIPGIGGHAVIVVGGRFDSMGRLFVRVADPSDGSINSMSFVSLRNNYRSTGGRWIRSYFTKPANQV